MPTPTPTVTPTPTPAPGPVTGELKPNAMSAIAASTQFLTINAARNITSERSVVAPPSPLTVSYDAVTRTYTLQNEQRTRQFGPSQFVGEASVPDYYPRVEYSSAASGEQDFLVVFKAPNAKPAMPFAYGAHGAWQHNSPQGSDTRTRLDYFTFGTPTPLSGMPTSGSVTYRFAGTGNFAEPNLLFFAVTSGTIRVDFAAGTVRATISPTGSDFFGGNFGGLTPFNLNGIISGNGATGASEFNAVGWSGNYKLQFYGPRAEEVGLVFTGIGFNASQNGALIGVTP
ncbi:MAG: hypothetical protein EOP62_17725 [Sphingomonadales bacterium]|nr:MAG: hypothetical protein EOP62_17725 [Sphingomonadales bacterium]